MEKELIVRNTINIKASAAEVWDALTNPEQTRKYMFGCDTVSDWKKGSPLLWRGKYEGNEMVFVKGEIADIRPGKFLAYTVIDPNSAIEDIPENYLTVTYELIQEEDHTILNVTQGDFSKVADSEKRYKDAYNNGDGWKPILVRIKALVEADH